MACTFDMDMLVLLTAMQSQAPGSAMGANAMMPLLMYVVHVSDVVMHLMRCVYGMCMCTALLS